MLLLRILLVYTLNLDSRNRKGLLLLIEFFGGVSLSKLHTSLCEIYMCISSGSGWTVICIYRNGYVGCFYFCFLCDIYTPVSLLQIDNHEWCSVCVKTTKKTLHLEIECSIYKCVDPHCICNWSTPFYIWRVLTPTSSKLHGEKLLHLQVYPLWQ